MSRVGIVRIVRSQLALAILSVAACSGIRPLDVAALTRSRPRTIAVAVSETPGLLTESGGLPTNPIIPVAMVIASSASIQHASANAEARRAMGIEDPASMVRGVVFGALVQRLGVLSANTRSFATAAEKPEAVASDAHGADLILDVRTTRWGIRVTRAYNALWLEYVGTMRLINGRTGAVLAEGSCSTPGPGADDELPPLQPQIGDGFQLKQELWVIATRCTDKYLTRVLRLSPKS